MTGEQSVTLNVKDEGFKEILASAKEFDPTLARNLRRNLRRAGQTAAGKVQAEVRSGSYAEDTGMREQIAQGIKVQVATGKRFSGIRIVSSGSALPAEKKPMVRAWQSKTGFRHPVHGDLTVWVVQHGHPYFFKPLSDERAAFVKAATTALADASATIKGV